MIKGKRKGSALDVPMAVLAASSVAFVAYAMPDWRFEAAVEASGLPLLLSAASPPLGMTARLAAVAAAGIGTFFLVWLTLRALGSKRPAPRRAVEVAELPTEAPKVRRADAHPDAPSRLPIRARLDLGEPAEPVVVLAEPDWPEEEIALDETEERPYPGFTLLEQPPEAEIFPEPFELSDRHLPTVEELVPPLPDVLEVEQESIPHLMQRLELGLARRQRNYRPVAAAEPITAGPRSQGDEAGRMDERLRSAIADLQKLAARN